MRTSETAVKAIKEFEGLRLAAYRCPGGVWTIGYGHTKGVRDGMACTETEADRWLREDLEESEKAVTALAVCKGQGQFDALVDFVFNLGIGALKRSALLRCIRRGDGGEEVCRQFRRWVYSGGRKLQGLVKRREWDAKRWTE